MYSVWMFDERYADRQDVLRAIWKEREYPRKVRRNSETGTESVQAQWFVSFYTASSSEHESPMNPLGYQFVTSPNGHLSCSALLCSALPHKPRERRPTQFLPSTK